MKRFTALLCAAVMIAVLMSGCAQKTSEIKDDADRLASEAKNELDDMIANGTVSDGDGYIDESRYPDETRRDETERYSEAETYDNTDGISYDGDDMNNDGAIIEEADPSDSSDFI